MGRDITMCHPELQEKAKKLVEECRKQGLIIKIGESFRSVAEQNALYAMGRTKPGSIVTYAKGSEYNSMHQWGVAFDVIRDDGKGAYYDNDGWFGKVGEIGKNLGLEWGGDWSSPVDKPHFQLPYWGSTPEKLKRIYGSFENFKKTWKVNISGEVDEEMVREGKAIVNGKEYKIDTILKDGVNYIKAGNFSNMGFDVGYDANTKAVKIDNKTENINVSANGNEKKVKSVNINGYNYVLLRDIAEILGKSVSYDNGEIKIE